MLNRNFGGSVLAKSAATAAVVAAVSAGVADRGGLVDVGLPGGGSNDNPASTHPDSKPSGQSGLTPSSAATWAMISRMRSFIGRVSTL